MRKIAGDIKGIAQVLRLLAALLMICVLIVPAAAQSDAEKLIFDIGRMNLPELQKLVEAITFTAGQDSLKLKSDADRGDCTDLTRAANSFALGIRSLDAIENALVGKPDRTVPVVRGRVIQSRVMMFAARVRAEEFLAGHCDGFVVSADLADDPRYASPVPVSNSDYTRAIVDARFTVESNIAAARAARESGDCRRVISSVQSITIVASYVDKLLKDVATRPQVLGPKASRAALAASRRQMVAAASGLDRDFGSKCLPAETPAPPAP